MTTRQRFLFDLTFKALIEVCEQKGRMVTAGELAKHMDIRRNTAANWLVGMWQEGAIRFETRDRGNVKTVRWGAWGYTFDGHKLEEDNII